MRGLRFFAEAIAPIPETVKYMGIFFDVKFKLLTNEEEQEVEREWADVAEEHQARQELISRLARALVEAQGVPVVFSADPAEDLKQRLAWATREWDEPFTTQMAESYERARLRIVHELQEIHDDPLPEAGKSEQSGEASNSPGNLRADDLTQESGPTSNTTPQRTRKRRRPGDLPSAVNS